MSTTISFRIDESLQRDLDEVEEDWQTGRSEAVRRLLGRALQDWKLERAVEAVRERRLSLGAAAEYADTTVRALLERLDDVDWTGYTEDDLERDTAVLEE